MKKTCVLSEMIMLAAILFLAGIIVPENAYAGYLDPGSGSTFMQAIIASIAAVQRFFRRLLGKRDE